MANAIGSGRPKKGGTHPDVGTGHKRKVRTKMRPIRGEGGALKNNNRRCKKICSLERNAKVDGEFPKTSRESHYVAHQNRIAQGKRGLIEQRRGPVTRKPSDAGGKLGAAYFGPIAYKKEKKTTANRRRGKLN